MSDLFGLSMTYIMIALLALLAGALASVGWVLARNRVLFFVGVRNIPRRRAQTILIIIGLMLSTVIISTAFSIGDTVDYSITNQAYSRLHSIDEVVQASAGGGDSGNGGDPGTQFSTSVVSARPIPDDKAKQFVASIRALAGVDGAARVIHAPVAVSDARSGQTEPVVVLTGVDATEMQGFNGDLQTTGGSQVSVADLAAGEIYVNKSAADKLAILKGDAIQVYAAGKPNSFTVKEVLNDTVLSGAAAGVDRGMTLSLAAAQQLFNRPNEVDIIAVSNDGGVRDSTGNSIKLRDEMNGTRTAPGVLTGTPWRAEATKKDTVDLAHQTSSFFTTFFVIMGLFAIASGMMLIFLIFVMLAAERRVEMGMVRAVGTKRLHLVQMFVSEGMAYNVMAAAVGCALGIAVSLIMVRVMAAIFAGFGLTIVFHVTPRSLAVSYALGVVLTFLTVTFSSWRISNLNIVAAIRDMAETAPRQERPSVTGIGGVFRYALWLLFKPTSWRSFFASIGIGIGGVALGAFSALFYVAGVAIYPTSAAGGAIAVLLFIAGGLVTLTAIVIAFMGFLRIFQLGGLAILLGLPLLATGFAISQAFPAGAGLTLEIGGVGLLAIQVGVPNRLAATVSGVVLLVTWLLLAGGQLFPNLSGGPEMFFLSGVTMILASTFVLIYNADLMLGVLTWSGGIFSSLVPSIRTAVAYPLANKFRTGITIAMISLVMFALVMISTMNTNFSRIFLGDGALGGYDVIVTENPTNHIEDVRGALQNAGGDGPATAAPITADDQVRQANQRVSEVRIAPSDKDPNPKFTQYTIVGPSQTFLTNNRVQLQARATIAGLDSDEAVWQYLASHADAAIIDGNALHNDGFGSGGFVLSGVKQGDKTFAPVHVQIRDASDPATARDIQIIGVITTQASGIFGGMFVAPQAFDQTFPRPEASYHVLKLQAGTDANLEAKSIEKTLLRQGAQADSLRKLIDDFQAAQRGILYLFQGFMGIGLFVGIAAVGVIAFRTVVERRQQIGMLRALGYTKNAVAISFIMESSFVALLGVLSGIGLALLLAYQLLNSSEFSSAGIRSFYIPWTQIVPIGLFAFVSSLLMTIIPSRQAASIPIAEALRYE